MSLRQRAHPEGLDGSNAGNPIAKPNGGYWNHAQEVKDAYTGLVRAEKH